MNFSSPLRTAILIRRYKRFLADIMLPNGKIVTIHCANTGAMTGCGAEGDIIWYSTSNNSKRKLPYSWELTVTQEKHWICINTNKANYIVKEAILQNQIEPLLHYSSVTSEVKYGNENSRIDLLLESEEKKKCYVEVKSVTLFDSDSCVGYFPDTTTLRGQKHLRELSTMAKNGHRAVIFFLVLHSGIKQFSPAKHIDPAYCILLENAINDGVEVLCYNTQISTNRITVHHPISILIA